MNCESCVNSYHAYCLNPPLEEVPDEGEWYCPKCMIQDPGKKAEKILTWRFIEITYPDPITKAERPKNGEEATEEQQDAQILKPPKKMSPRKEKEFFIKWKSMSYWHSSWVSELLMETYFPHLLRSYWKKVDPENPPEVDDDSNEETGESDGKEKEDDPHNLEEKFYRYGIKPEWLQVNRVLHHASYEKGQYDYYVKWKELSYDQATWERDDQAVPGYEEQIFKYWLHRYAIHYCI